MAQPILFKLLEKPTPTKGFAPLIPNAQAAPLGGSRLLLPTDISGLFAWYYAKDAASVDTTNNNVWTDHAGLGPALTQTVAGSRPTYTGGTTPQLAFSGTDVLNLSGAPTTYDAVAVVTTNSSSATWRTLFWAQANANTLLLETGTDRYGVYDGAFEASGSTIAPSTMAVVHVRVDSTGFVHLSLNGGTVTGPIGNFSIIAAASRGINALGSSGDGTQPFGLVHGTAIYTGNLSASDLAKVIGSMAWDWGLQGSLDPSSPYVGAAPTIGTSSPDVTLALTGQSLTGTIGSLLATTALALTGAALSASQGSVAPQASFSVSGQSLAAAQGTASPVTSVALTGQSLSAAQGSVLQGAPITGQSATVAQGSAPPVISIALTGQSLSVARGTVTPTTAAGLTGQAIASAQGLVLQGAPITGQHATAAIGSAAPGISVALTGQAVSGSSGTVSPASSLALSGQSLTTASGSLVAARSFALSGQGLSGARGSVLASSSLALTGGALAVAQGTVAPGAPSSAALTGQSVITAGGTASPGTSIALTGLSVTTAQGLTSPSIAAASIGQAGTVGQGSVAQALSLNLSGQAAVVAYGTVTPATVAFTGGQAIGVVSGIPAPATSIGIAGLQTASAQGEIVASIVTLSGPASHISLVLRSDREVDAERSARIGNVGADNRTGAPLRPSRLARIFRVRR